MGFPEDFINLETGKIDPANTPIVQRCIARQRANGRIRTKEGLADIAASVMLAHCLLITARDKIYAERSASPTKTQEYTCKCA